MKRRDFITTGATVAASVIPLQQLFANTNKRAEQSVSSVTNYDVIVLGVGSMGSSACYHLAKLGVKVLGIEQFDIPHELGSHAGQSRIIRKAYSEHPDYVPLLERAYNNWRAMEAETGAELYFKTGIMYFGLADNPDIAGLRKSASLYSVKVEDIPSSQLKAKYPQFRIPENYERILEPDAGFVTPERAILVYTERALLNGASIHTHEKTLEWKSTGKTITVKTDKHTYECKKLIVTVGAWSGKMIPGFASKLTITKQMLAWVKPKNWKQFELGRFPCWSISDHEEGGAFYGFPILPVSKFGGPVGLKLAHHFHGAVSDPDTINRNATADDDAILIKALSKFFPEGYESTLVMKTCLYTNSPDENFIVDYLPGYDKNVAVAAGFSGHGFKFISVIGEILADLAVKGSTVQPIAFLKAKRLG